MKDVLMHVLNKATSLPYIIMLIISFSDKEIEELKLSQQRELDLSKKEAEMAAEVKFGDGLTEARKAYAALKHLLDSQVRINKISVFFKVFFFDSVFCYIRISIRVQV